MKPPAKPLDLLRRYESRNVTFIDKDGSWPICWERAQGIHVWNVEGNKFVDFTAAFGVAAAGHGNRRVVAAGQKQMAKLLHAMGDVHPHRLKGLLAEQLSRLTFERWSGQGGGNAPSGHTAKKRAWGKTIFGGAGFEAVEAALKTATLATGKREIIAFEGAYHGTGYGTLNATHRGHFRDHFRSQIAEFGWFVPFPRRDADLPEIKKKIIAGLRRGNTAAILVEPIQTRGGVNIPPSRFLPMLRQICDQFGLLLILDEIYTGFGRAGQWFACESTGTIPDLICVGKALTGGFPLSACVGRHDLMDLAWPDSTGEAIHTSTFLGHPVGCAMALAQLKEIAALKLPARSAERGGYLLELLRNLRSPENLKLTARGVGLLVGLEFAHADGAPASEEVFRIIKKMLKLGYILIPEGEFGNVIGFTPPLIISAPQIRRMTRTLQKVILADFTAQNRGRSGTSKSVPSESL